jgi:acyl carrier protein
MTTNPRDAIEQLANECLNGSTFDFDTPITEYGGDAMDEIEILIALEDKFNIELPDERYSTLNDFLKAVEYQLKVQ